MITRRTPRPALRPFVRALWAIDGSPEPAHRVPRERVLPTGEMHIAFRISGPPFRFFDDSADAVGHRFGHAVVGGPRITPYFKDVSAPAVSIGAFLRPGASELLFGVPPVELAGSHVPLETVWGRAGTELHERLAAARSAERRLDVLEQALAALLPRARGLHPAVAHALERFEAGSPIGEVVRQTGYSHRRFIDLFRHSVGFGPKVYCRVRRFHDAFTRLTEAPDTAGGVAFDAGYADQAHLIRDFRDFAGITPGEYRRVEPPRPGHVPIR